MESILPLDKMTTLEKLRALEEIWTDLNNNPQDVQVPEWHIDVLAAREKRVQEGTSAFTDWKEARQAIRDQIR